jgi:transposase
VPALPPYLIEPIWEQFAAMLPQREVNHPLGCHRSRIPDRVVFEKLVQVLVFGCAYHRIADESCSATTLRERRDEWIELGVIDALREAVLEAYDRFIGLDLSEVAVDCCITKAQKVEGKWRAEARWTGANAGFADPCKPLQHLIYHWY